MNKTPNIPVNVTSLFAEPKNNSFTFGKILLYFSVLILALFLGQSLFQFFNNQMIQKNIEELRVGDKVAINGLNGIVNKINHHSIFLNINDNIIEFDKKIIQKITITN